MRLLPSSLSFRAVVVVAGSSALAAFGQPAPGKVKVDDVYQQYCASCHGAKLEGGSGSALLGPTWKHGGDADSLFKVIKEGVPDTAMIGWANLGESTLRALAIYISERAYAAAKEKTPARDTTSAIAGPVTTQEHSYRIETVVTGLTNPWSLAWLPDGRRLVTERPGRLRILNTDNTLSAPIKGTPEVFARGQGGLLEVAVHPDYARNGWIYLAYSDPQKLDGRDVSLTAIVRGKIEKGEWKQQQQIFRAPVEFYQPTNIHFGCRLVFDRGYLFFSMGERGRSDHAQDITRPNGKIHRIFDDGRVPTDNPFSDQKDAFPTLWTYGNRNPQGLVRHPVTGELWETEHGPRGGDELNLIKRGANYGWPKASYGMNYDGSPLTSDTSLPGMVDPVIYWLPSIAASGLDVYVGDAFPKWKNNLLAGGLAKQEIHRLVVENGKVTHREIIFSNQGRVRDVCVGPDGLIYVVIDATEGKILRLRPL
mgnify:CR=1 FL=1